MNDCAFDFAGTTLRARGSGALYWPDAQLLCVSDLHLGKSDRVARRSGQILPPYETRDTLLRLQEDLETTRAKTVICLGDSFDDLASADALSEDDMTWIARLQAGRQWIWIEGNHDPGPVALGGSHMAEWCLPPLTFRHIATDGVAGEVSGHFHPKASLPTRGRTVTRPCFVFDAKRLILPAYGTYTGGLRTSDPALDQLMAPDARAILIGPRPVEVPMPR